MLTGIWDTWTGRVKIRLEKEYYFQDYIIYLANVGHCHVCYLIQSSKQSSGLTTIVYLHIWQIEIKWTTNLLNITIKKY